ncbi:GIY-YIG nuclease family protein [Streptomyces mirabilis]|uniref:GIY-YIG nuclease family protein n=1 Tax=Streptomyces mirabilis TaxID=68239 RepID=UPI003248D897
MSAEPTALYRLYDAGGDLLYIGITDCPERRFKQHRNTKPWWPKVSRKTTEWHPTRRRALAEEAAAVVAETPVYNVQYNPAAPVPVSPHQPPTDMPQDRVVALREVASTFPAHIGDAILRAGFEGFIRTAFHAPAAREAA